MNAKILLILGSIALSAVTAASDEMRRTGTGELAAAREEAQHQRDLAAAALRQAQEKVDRLAKDDPAVVRDALEGKIVNGVLTHEFPTVGALLKGDSESGMGSHCSGTLVGCSTFITARHCVASSANPKLPAGKSEFGKYRVFLQHGGMFGITGIATHKDYNGPHADIAVLTLDRPVDGITTTPLNVSTVIPLKTPGVIVGYGRSGGIREDYGLKRRGRVATAACSRPESSLLCWDFDVAEKPGHNSNTCNADSGGPLFVDQPGSAIPTLMLAGVTSGGTRTDCLLSDNSYDVDVRQFASWAAQQTKDKLGALSCGTLPQWGSKKVTTHEYNGHLKPGSDFASTSITVAANTRVLRIAMNAEDTWDEIDFDLFVKAGSPASATSADCARTFESQYAFCEFQNPTAGKWYLRVDRKKGTGVYQLTSSAYLK